MSLSFCVCWLVVACWGDVHILYDWWNYRIGKWFKTVQKIPYLSVCFNYFVKWVKRNRICASCWATFNYLINKPLTPILRDVELSVDVFEFLFEFWSPHFFCSAVPFQWHSFSLYHSLSLSLSHILPYVLMHCPCILPSPVLSNVDRIFDNDVWLLLE